MTPSQATLAAIFTLRYAATPEAADRAIGIAASRGVDADTCNTLRREWADFYARSVQRLGGDQ